MKLNIFVDGKELKANKDDNLLSLLLNNGFDIPALCYHEGIPSYGACRLCSVEVGKGEKRKLVASCTYPVREENIEVTTNSKKVNYLRKMIIKFLLARSPEVEKLHELAKTYEVEEEIRFNKETEEKSSERCILCGKCVRVCNDVLKKHAISFINRGIDRRVASPFDEPPEDCIGCSSCVYVCPTGKVTEEIENDKKNIYPWKAEHKLMECTSCGVKFLTEDTIEEVKNKSEVNNLIDEIGQELLCLECKRKRAIKNLQL